MTAAVCTRCGLEHPKCAGHNKAGKPCGRIPRGGINVCPSHGGQSPQVLAAQRRREVEAKAAEVLRRARWREGMPLLVENPLEELSRVAGEAVAFKDYLRNQVDQLDGLLTYWQEKDYLDGDGGIEWTKAAEEVRAVVAAYERSLDRAAKILATIVKLDLAGRMLELRTEQADAIVGAVRHGLTQVDMPAEIRRGAENAIADAIAGMTRPTAQPKELSA